MGTKGQNGYLKYAPLEGSWFQIYSVLYLLYVKDTEHAHSIPIS